MDGFVQGPGSEAFQNKLSFSMAYRNCNRPITKQVSNGRKVLQTFSGREAAVELYGHIHACQQYFSAVWRGLEVQTPSIKFAGMPLTPTLVLLTWNSTTIDEYLLSDGLG